jgi:hypothetical protein
MYLNFVDMLAVVVGNLAVDPRVAPYPEGLQFLEV